MKRSDSPSKQPKPFGINGQREDILPTTPSGDNTASYESGFPPITMILKSAGGLPPKGQDMNQILYELSALCRWASAGALNTFDSTFSTGIGGYPKGSLLFSDDGLNAYINTTDDNTANPNSGGSGWKDLFTFMGLGSAAKLSAPTALSSDNGWMRIPYLLGGVEKNIILQWGTFVNDATGDSTVLFPIPFPTAARQLVACGLSTGTGTWAGYNTLTNTGFKGNMWASSTVRQNGQSSYWAIGE
ncbi:gp53-like domain-containing protein [Citrobacter braakii]|uniref:gp53-like domain-containing protein n=1 Tax=Citrobacter braakii TaxID=57706 RepID=UPI003080E47D